MEVSSEILAAARAFGEQLNATPEVRALRAAESEVQNDPAIAALEAEVMTRYNDLVSRQRAGDILAPQEINQFYHLRDQLARHPLVTRRDEAVEAVKALFQGAGSAISSVLTVDYTALVLEEQD
jgi:cell fate (sporulation/competence/biofilm development) regulator YlbF (YheA/YmcA/DUF963 family)